MAMLRPTYSDLMDIANNDVHEGGTPDIKSRYSVVIAASKRARQLVDRDEPLVAAAPDDKPLSVAVEELYEEKVKILGEGSEGEDA